MFAMAKAMIFAMTLTGVAAGAGLTDAIVNIPLEQAKEIHYDHLGDSSTMPSQATNGQQNSLDHIVLNQERFMAKQNITIRAN